MAERKCNATSKQTGKPCGGNACTGLEKCTKHCGLSKAKREAIAAAFLADEAARKAVVTYGLPRDISPSEALLEEVRYSAGHVAWLRQKVAELEDADLVWGITEEAEKNATEFAGTDITRAASVNMWVELYFRERKHLVEVTKAAISAGIEERRVRLAEAQGAVVAEVIRRILDRLDLSAVQSKLVPLVVPEELRRAAALALN
jgi:hypothetical protein